MLKNLDELVIYPQDYESLEANVLINRMYQELTLLYGGTPDGKFTALDLSQHRSVFVNVNSRADILSNEFSQSKNLSLVLLRKTVPLRFGEGQT
ncbi:hypothetical protein NIES25_46180 [Nostoc linckia NIES-25]|nr:hypothetical protein NIES25_46180 [Nostoc linckia NIES-25]